MNRDICIRKIQEMLDAAAEAHINSKTANESVYHRAEKETLVKVLTLLQESD